jgi:hypothetical protein
MKARQSVTGNYYLISLIAEDERTWRASAKVVAPHERRLTSCESFVARGSTFLLILRLHNISAKCFFHDRPLVVLLFSTVMLDGYLCAFLLSSRRSDFSRHRGKTRACEEIASHCEKDEKLESVFFRLSLVFFHSLQSHIVLM